MLRLPARANSRALMLHPCRSSAAAHEQQEGEEQEAEERQRSGAAASRPGSKRRQSSRQRRRQLEEEEEEGEAPSPRMPRQQSASSLSAMPAAPQAMQQDGAAPADAAAAQMRRPILVHGEVQSGLPTLLAAIPLMSPVTRQQGLMGAPATSSAAAAASASLGSQQRQQQRAQQQMQTQSVGRPAPLRPQQASWSVFAYAAACRALVHRQRRMQFVRQVGGT